MGLKNTELCMWSINFSCQWEEHLGRIEWKAECHNQLIIQANSNGKRQFSKKKSHFENKGTYQNLQFYLNDVSFFICFIAASTQGAKADRVFLGPLILVVPLTTTLGLECTNRKINQKEQRTFKNVKRGTRSERWRISFTFLSHYILNHC